MYQKQCLCKREQQEEILSTEVKMHMAPLTEAEPDANTTNIRVRFTLAYICKLS
jgi:hypothetical protein